MELDKKRSIYDKLSVEEKEILKENMRLFKHPKFMKKEQSESDATTKKEFTSEKNHSDQKTSHKSRYKVNYVSMLLILKRTVNLWLVIFYFISSI